MNCTDYTDDVFNTAMGVNNHGVMLLDVYKTWCADELHYLVCDVM